MTSERPLDETQTLEPPEPGRARRLRNYMIAGLLIWLPIMITVWVVRFLTGILDQSLVLIPPPWRPEALFGRYIPGLGIIMSLLLLLVTGVLVKNLFGRQMVQGLENLIRRIPVIGPVYGGAKTFSETVLADKGRSFKQVVLVRFPHPGVYSIGFMPYTPAGLPWNADFDATLVNYVPLAILIPLIFGVWYLISAKKTYKGPVRTLEEDEITAD